MLLWPYNYTISLRRSKVALSMCKFCLFVYMYTQLCVWAQTYKHMHNLSLSAPKQHLNCNFSSKNSIPLPRTSPQSFWCKDFLELEKIQRQFGQYSWENRNHSNVSWTPCEPLPRPPHWPCGSLWHPLRSAWATAQCGQSVERRDTGKVMADRAHHRDQSAHSSFAHRALPRATLFNCGTPHPTGGLKGISRSQVDHSRCAFVGEHVLSRQRLKALCHLHQMLNAFSTES